MFPQESICSFKCSELSTPDMEETTGMKMKRRRRRSESGDRPTNAEDQSDDQECLRIVLIGRTGNGKSATGNTILGKNEFQSELSLDSVTNFCEKRVCKIEDKSVAVVDTPGLFDTTLTNELAMEEIMKCVSLLSPGPHVFVIVLSLGRFTKEEGDTVYLIKKIFGPKSSQFSIVLFTRGDDLGKDSIQQYVEKCKSAELKKLIRDCGNRFLVFNNRENQDRTQVIQLLNMIEEVKNTNDGQYFTNSMFEETEMAIKKRMKEILKEKEREIENRKDELKAKYKREFKDRMKKFKEENQRKDEERRKITIQIREEMEKLKQNLEAGEKMKKEINEQMEKMREKNERDCNLKSQINDLNHKLQEEISMRQIEAFEREKRAKKLHDDMKLKHEDEIRRMRRKYECDARKQTEQFNVFRRRHEQHIWELKDKMESLKKKRSCVIM